MKTKIKIKAMKEFVKFNRKYRLKHPLIIRDISEVSIKNRKFSRFAEGDENFKEAQEDFRRLKKRIK
jgi:hypothetical protein